MRDSTPQILSQIAAFAGDDSRIVWHWLDNRCVCTVASHDGGLLGYGEAATGREAAILVLNSMWKGDQ